MDKDFITIREATELTGKADITIRRLIKDLIKQDNPEATHLIKQEKTGGGFVYKINGDFLLRELKISEPTKEPEEKKELADKTAEKQQAEPPEIIKGVIATLTDQLKVKDTQIRGLGNKIDSLIERDRETNVLLKGLQDRVFMLEAPKEQEETGLEPQEAENKHVEAERGEIQPIKEELEDRPEKKKKRGFLGWLFSDNGLN